MTKPKPKREKTRAPRKRRSPRVRTVRATRWTPPFKLVFQAYCFDCGKPICSSLKRDMALKIAQGHADDRRHECAVMRYVTPFHFGPCEIRALRNEGLAPSL